MDEILNLIESVPEGFPSYFCHGLENETFSRSGKIREFCGWSGKFRKALESQGKVREFENKWLWQADLRKFILFKREKDVLSHEIV